MKLSNENIEEYLLLLADNELDEAEEQELRLYIAEHQAYKPMMDAYLATRLDSAETFIFPDKESLLQPEPVVVPLRKTGLKPLKLAAAVAVLLGLGTALALMFLKEGTTNNNNSIAVERTNKSKTVQTAISVPDPLPLAQVAHVERQTANSPRHTLQQRMAQNKQVAVAEKEKAQKTIPVPVYLESTALNKMSTAVGVEPEAIVMVQKENAGELNRSKMPEWLPVNEENLQGVNNLIAHIQELKENIQEKTRSLKNTAFVLRIGDKQITLSKPAN